MLGSRRRVSAEHGALVCFVIIRADATFIYFICSCCCAVFRLFYSQDFQDFSLTFALLAPDSSSLGSYSWTNLITQMVVHGMKMIYEHMPCHCAISCHFLVESEDRPNLRLRTGASAPVVGKSRLKHFYTKPKSRSSSCSCRKAVCDNK